MKDKITRIDLEGMRRPEALTVFVSVDQAGGGFRGHGACRMRSVGGRALQW